ncbi:MAG: VCBS repeat-containing protein, partial [Planctomycetes bacterium]|nr:VCBS repeat-containing protein [Planctomycetota bacterium]
MKIKKIKIFILLLVFIASFITAAVPAPVFKWRNGGFSPAQFNKGMYTSPALLDINQDGIKEVIWANFKVFAFNGATGAIIWSFWAGNERGGANDYNSIGTDTNVAVADINNDGFGEIVTAHTNGLLCVYDRNGYFLDGFPLKPLGRTESIESLSVFDLDNDGYCEIIIGWANPYDINLNPNAHLNICVIGHDGAIKPGWPQYVPNPNANALGIFGQNIAVGDINRDGFGEVVAPSDTGKTCAYYHDGSALPINPAVYRTSWMTVWPDVVNYENYDHEKLGWYLDGPFYMCTDYPATIADVNADGSSEIIIVGGVYTCPGEHPTDDDYEPLYNTPFIYNLDRTRFNYGTYNWESDLPKTGAPLTNSWTVAPLKRANPVVVDIDGDGKKEILSSSFDGKLHCYWLDKTEHGSWPFPIYDPAEGTIRFSSEPTVADLDGDGSLEVIFTSWPQYHSHKGGHLFILNSQGSLLHKKALPYGDLNGNVGELDYDGCLAAPTIGDVDGDGQVEIVLGTVYAGLVVYDLPGAVMGSAPWPTGRHDYARTGWVDDTSNTVGIDSVQVLAPNGGENWNGGTVHDINWSSTGSGSSVNIHFSTNGGSSWAWMAAGTNNNGSFSWEVPAMLSANCLVRVSDTDGDPSDVSDRVFSISSTAAETVTTPGRPAGAASGAAAASYAYSTGGSASNLGHSLQYMFDWGDGSDSGWLAPVTTTAARSWSAAGTYNVRARARCATHTAIESPWSTTLSVIIYDGDAAGAYNSPAQYKVLPEVIWSSATGGGTWMSNVQV